MSNIRSLNSPAAIHAVITPNDATPVKESIGFAPTKCYVNTTGTLVIEDEAGTEVTYNVFAGQLLWFIPHLLKTGSTAELVGQR